MGGVVHLDSGLCIFLKGSWDVATFIFNYGIVNPYFSFNDFTRRLMVLKIALAGGLGLGFKVFARTPFHRSKDVDLKSDLDFLDAIDSYYQDFKDDHPSTAFQEKILVKIF